MTSIVRAALLAALTWFPAAAFAQDLFVPAPAPSEKETTSSSRAPEAPVAPDGRAALVGTWKLDAKGGIKCGDGTIHFSQASSGALSGYADVGMTDPTSDFRDISVSGPTVTLTYGYFNAMNGDPRIKTLSGQFDEARTTIRGVQLGQDVDGCTFTMTKR